MTPSLPAPFTFEQLPTVALSVGHDMGTFTLADGPRIDLRSLGPMRRVFGLLVQMHCASPTRSATIEEIFDVAWPADERLRMTVDGRRNRVYVAISKLRGRGLSSVLVRTDAGYQLDPRCLVIREGSLVARPAPRAASRLDAHRAKLAS